MLNFHKKSSIGGISKKGIYFNVLKHRVLFSKTLCLKVVLKNSFQVTLIQNKMNTYQKFNSKSGTSGSHL
jgi:hypothetical protein